MSTDTKQIEDGKKSEAEVRPRYRVLCWGTHEEGEPPCALFYPTASGERKVTEGHIAVGLPEQSVAHELRAGHIELVVEEGTDEQGKPEKEAT